MPNKNDTVIWRSILAFFLLYPFINAWSGQKNESITETIYFYNPESNINNFASLKISFDTYLSKFGLFQFQPFNKKEIFENSIIEHPQNVFLLSSWHFQYLSDEIDIHPIMVGVLNGESTHKKILATQLGVKEINDLKGKTIASSGSKLYTKNLLKEMLGGQAAKILPTLKLILVPKDIDALMAIGFGMASAALSSEHSFEILKQINYKQHQQLKPLAESQQHLLVLVAVTTPEHKNNDEILDVLEKMGINTEGETRLRMLGLDALRKLTAQEQLLLMQQRGKGL